MMGDQKRRLTKKPIDDQKINNRVLSQAFTLSHDSYATIRSNYRKDALA